MPNTHSLGPRLETKVNYKAEGSTPISTAQWILAQDKKDTRKFYEFVLTIVGRS